LIWYVDGTFEVWDTAADALLDRRHLGARPGSYPAVTSRDGRLVAATCGGLFLYDVATLRPRKTPSTDSYGLAISPDNRLLAASKEDGTLVVVDTLSGKTVFSLVGHQHLVDSLAFSPDGRTLAAADHGGAVRLWNVATREELFVLRRLDSNAHIMIDFSPDGQCLAAATGDREAHGRLYLWPTSFSSSAAP
jgi:WD40 repeat protein